MTVCEPVLITAKDAANICGVSLSTWNRMNSSGLVPKPVRLLGTVRWQRDEITAWIAAGCPGRDKWETIKKITPLQRVGKRVVE